ncbi:MAG: bifunctional nuclease family protein [Marinilabiliaceae bacterium]|nr:bifunctional nuclease family protein [Marinilabiliaceae bacterium]
MEIKEIKIELEMVSVYGTDKEDVFVMLLKEKNGERKIPVLIGPAEAKMVAVQKQRILMPRPFLYDTLLKMSKQFDFDVKEIVIYKIESQVFFSEIVCCRGEKEVAFDSRTSDAVALALTFDAPIYAYDRVFQQIREVLPGEPDGHYAPSLNLNNWPLDKDLSGVDEKVLVEKMKEAIDKELYEMAGRIRDELKRRQS